MALVESFRASNGVLVRIFDDCYAGVPKEELERRREHAREVAFRVALNITNRQLKERREAQEKQRKE